MTTNTLLLNNDLCSGCTACYNICPTKAISLSSNREGFLYPEINETLCIDCNKCISVCQIHNSWENLLYKPLDQSLYAAKAKNELIRSNSSSGGLFTVVAQKVLEKDGLVYAVKLDSDLNCVHFRISTIEELEKARGSKYVQSNLKVIFNNIKIDLNKKKMVLFVGTPCQVAGLKFFLKNEHPLLFTIDLFCLGVCSPLIYNKWLDYLNKEKIKTINFRNKTMSWHNSKISVSYNRNKNLINRKTQLYSTLFGNHFILRKSCYICQFSKSKRLGDISLGDFWGIETLHPEFDDDKGISALIINTNKGYEMFNTIKPELDVLQSHFGNYLQFQPCLHKPAWLPKNREQFWNEYFKKGFERTAKKYVGKDIISRGIRLIKRLVNVQR